MQRIRIAVVDNHALVRKSLSSLIDSHSGAFSVCLQCSDGQELISAIRLATDAERPEIVLSDLDMPRMDGYETTLWLKSRFPGIKVIIVSMRSDEVTIIRLIKAGAAGYLVKNFDFDDLNRALETVANGGIYFSPFDLSRAEHADIHPAINTWYSLSQQEREFVRLCVTELEDREILQKLGVRSYESLPKKIYGKFGVKTRVGLVLLISKHKLFDLE